MAASSKIFISESQKNVIKLSEDCTSYEDESDEQRDCNLKINLVNWSSIRVFSFRFGIELYFIERFVLLLKA